MVAQKNGRNRKRIPVVVRVTVGKGLTLSKKQLEEQALVVQFAQSGVDCLSVNNVNTGSAPGRLAGVILPASQLLDSTGGLASQSVARQTDMNNRFTLLSPYLCICRITCTLWT